MHIEGRVHREGYSVLIASSTFNARSKRAVFAAWLPFEPKVGDGVVAPVSDGGTGIFRVTRVKRVGPDAYTGTVQLLGPYVEGAECPRTDSPQLN